MPDITITIADPVIVFPAKFKFRYRALPGGSFSAYTDEGNTISLTGLAVGTYEYEIIYVNDDGIECAPIVGTFNVIEEIECNDFTVVQVIQGGITYFEISYTGSVMPPCGWNLYYRPVGDPNPHQNKHYPVLPASPFLYQVDPNTDYEVIIYANLCTDSTECYNETVPMPPEPTCFPRVVTSVVITPTQIIPNGDYKVLITVNYTESTPVTSGNVPFNVSYSQLGINSGTPPVSSTVVVPASVPFGSAAIALPVLARYRDFSNNPVITPIYLIRFEGTITDICGNSHYWYGELEV